MKSNLDTDNINKLLWSLSIPAILGMLSGAIFNVVDRIFVERVNEYALTAVGITMPIQILHMGFILLIGVGSSSLISIKLGENKKEEAEQLLYLCLKYIIIILIIFATLFAIFCDDILEFLNVSSNVYDMAKQYIMVLIIGSVISIPGYALNNSMRAIGKTSVSTKIIVISSIVNIILDPIFIFGFDLGVFGAAIATVISQTVLTIYVIYYFVTNKEIPINLHFKKVSNEKEKMSDILKAGSASFYVQVLATFVNAYINTQILKYGTDFDVGAVLVASTIFTFYHMVIFGIVHGNQPICGFNFGAKRFDRVKKSLELSLFYATLISLSLFAVVMLYPEILAKIFSEDSTHLESKIKAIRWYLAMIPLIGMQTISSQYFISVGKTKLASVLSMLRYGIILVPIVTIVAPRFGVNGIYASYALSDFLASSIAIFFIVREIKSLNKMIKSNQI